MARHSLGQFIRTRVIWTPENWDAGYIDNRNRFRVYRPDCPRAYNGGYAFRAHVVWWLYHNKPHPSNTELHHIDHNRLNDDISNLNVLSRSEHRTTHQEHWVYRRCKHCGKEFRKHFWRTKQSPIRFCSRKCYLSAPRPERKKRVKIRCGSCNKHFEVTPFFAKQRKFCSWRCSGIAKRGKPRPRSISIMPPP